VTRVFKVNAKRWKRGWELHIDGVGVTQVKRLNDAEAMVRDYIALDLDIDPHSFEVEIVPDMGSEMGSSIRQAWQAAAEAEQAQHRAVSQSRKVVATLAEEGLTGREIAMVLKVSPQRVSQLLKDARAGRTAFRRSRVPGKTDGVGRRRANA
jgi:DNA-directed RNA polymerase specialized sigma24 family protein